MATENCFLDDDLNVDDFSNIDASLIMSLLEDSQAEDGDDHEMLRSMIDHSLEPEMMMNQDSSSEYCRFSDECCSASPDHDHPDFEWLDMEMEMTGYFTGRFTGGMVENIGGLEEDYSQVCCYGMPMEEDDYIGLWQ